MTKKVYLVMAVSLVGLAACGSGNASKKAKKAAEEVKTEIEAAAGIISPDKCRKDEGYFWSGMEQQCVNLFERGEVFISVENPDMDHLLYAVFKSDSSKVEIFTPGKERTEVLDRRMAKDGPVWNIEDDDTKNVRKKDGKWVIERRGKVEYKYAEDLQPIKARFQGSDGVTRMLYWVDATFYPAHQHATLTLGDKAYDLKQYPTASGYGYKNKDADLRGKGDEATLTFTDPEVRDLKLRDVTGEE